MPLLSNSEATTACDAFLITVYGEEIFRRWKELKSEMDFTSEREYMAWLIDVAYQYKSDELLMENNNAMFHMDPDFDDESKGMERSRDRISEKSDSDVLSTEVASSGAGDGMAGGDSCVSGGAADNSYLNEKYSLESDTVMYLSDDEDDTQYVLQDEDTNGSRVVFPPRPGGAGPRLKARFSSSFDIEKTGVDSAASSALASPASVEVAGAGVRSFRCHICAHSTLHRSSLSRHVKIMHSGVKPFQCEYCNYQATVGSNLKQHLIRKHGFAGDHSCGECGKQCVSRKDLMKHETKHHSQRQKQQHT